MVQLSATRFRGLIDRIRERAHLRGRQVQTFPQPGKIFGLHGTADCQYVLGSQEG